MIMSGSSLCIAYASTTYSSVKKPIAITYAIIGLFIGSSYSVFSLSFKAV